MVDVTKKDLKILYNQLKTGAKKRNINFNLSMSDLNNLSFPLTCPILNIPLTFNNGNAKDNSYSIDRIDSSKGYVIDNIIVVSNKVNKLKSNATILELKQIADFYMKLHIESY